MCKFCDDKAGGGHQGGRKTTVRENETGVEYDTTRMVSGEASGEWVQLKLTAFIDLKEAPFFITGLDLLMGAVQAPGSGLLALTEHLTEAQKLVAEQLAQTELTRLRDRIIAERGEQD